jgi:hypothetical protein
MSVGSYFRSRALPMLATFEGSSVDNMIYLIRVSSGWMDFLEVLESGMASSGVTWPRPLSTSGDGATRSRHLQNHVGVMRDRHELGKCRLSQESIVCSLKMGHLELHGFSSEVHPSPEGYGKRDMTDRCRCCTRDNTMERSPAGPQKRTGQPHLVESFQKKDVEGAASINEYSVELNILNDGVDY